MFGDSDRDKAAWLMAAERECLERARFSQPEGLRLLAEAISHNRYFDAQDPARLANRVAECRHNGRVLDLDDTELQRGGEPARDTRGVGRSIYGY